MPTHYTALFDASVLYPAPIRDLLVQCASSGLFRGKLTQEINSEWVSNLLAQRPDLRPQQLERTCQLLEQAMPDCMVTGYELIVEGLTLPDPNDRHVLAAAVCCQAQAIVTFNLRDFPEKVLTKLGIEVLHPDIFLRSQADLAAPQFLSCVKAILSRLKAPPVTAHDYLITLASVGLVQTSSFLLDYILLL